MKKFAAMMMVLVILTMGMAAHGEVTSADVKALRDTKVFQTEGTLTGTWTIQFERNDDNLYPCMLDLGDGRIVTVPLTDDEVNDLMYKALEEHNAKAKEEAKAKEVDDRTFIAKAVDWVTFWN